MFHFNAAASLPVALLLLSASAGCISGAEPSLPDAGSPAATGEGTAALRLELEGYLWYRLASSGEDGLRYDGDSPVFCFEMPENTTRLRVEFTWDTPNQMILGFRSEADSSDAHSAPEDRPPRNVTPPLILDIHNPTPGPWNGGAIPWAAGAATNWNLTLTWDVARANATLSEVQHDGGACFQDSQAERP